MIPPTPTPLSARSAGRSPIAKRPFSSTIRPRSACPDAALPIATRLSAIEVLEEMARAIYREWFVHFRFPGHEHHPTTDTTMMVKTE